MTLLHDFMDDRRSALLAATQPEAWWERYVDWPAMYVEEGGEG